MAQRVNLDAMIAREDTGVVSEEFTLDLFKDFPLANLGKENPISNLLRKPDFQRETNHWSPEQVVSLIESFLDNEVIPGLILWKSARFIFVLDGGHRLSALKAWMEDDYGDGPITLAFYKGATITKEQKKAAKRTRKIIEEKIGTFQKLKQILAQPTGARQKDSQRANRAFMRGLPLQWVQGSKDLAESSFFKINSQGTPLDPTETLLIKNRRRPIAIGARAILRAGSGNKYWADFQEDKQKEFVQKANEFFELLFQPESDTPVKTLDLPLAGSIAPVDALAVLIDFLTIAGASTPKTPMSVSEYDDDDIGDATLQVMSRALQVLNRITGNSPGSLGLHPAVYFYNDRGKHNRYMFLGFTQLIAERVRNNDSNFFAMFTGCRAKLEEFLLENKSWINLLLSNMSKAQRVNKSKELYSFLVARLGANEIVSPEETLAHMGLSGRFIDIERIGNTQQKVSDDTKSMAYLIPALQNALKCKICGGLVDPGKSISYDHIVRVRDGGTGTVDNVQITHPYCNTGLKS